MDETIGSKGGKNDRRRSFFIRLRKQKKEDESSFKELEKKVKKKQVYTLIKTLPIVLTGGMIQSIYRVSSSYQKEDKEEENSKWKIPEYDADFSSKPRNYPKTVNHPQKKVVYVSQGKKVEVHLFSFPDKRVEERKEMNSTPHKKEELKEAIPFPEQNKFLFVDFIDQDNHKEEVFSQSEKDPDDFSDLTDEQQKILQELKSHKIIVEYEKKLKDIRFDLRQIIYDYQVLADEEEKVVLKKEAEKLFDQLSFIISQIEELKSKIQIDNIDRYDDQYLYYLIEDYLDEFQDGKILSELKDSPLYVLISERLNELEKKKNSFSKKVEDKKEKLEKKEIAFEQFKNKYYSIEDMKKNFEMFQKDQEKYLVDLQYKINNATSIKERVDIQFQGLNAQSKKLLKFLTFSMLFPGSRMARGMALSTLSYLALMSKIVQQHTITKKYQVVEVMNYSQEIENSMESIRGTISLIGKTSGDIDKMILEIKDRFSDYFGVLPECDELLSNLLNIKKELEEKEYEMKKILKQQEEELERNNAKVKKMGEYPVN